MDNDTNSTSPKTSQLPSKPPTPPRSRARFSHALPPLDLPDFGEPVIPLHVLDYPTTDQGTLLTWTVDKQPSRKIRYGQLVSIWTPGDHTGVGMLTAVSELRRYWITWTVSSGSARCKITIPTSWTTLYGIEAVAHEKHYTALPSTPPPHRNDPIWLLHSFVNPYPYTNDIPPDERQRRHEQLETITKRRWQWRAA